jgi:MoaA/NifB/PqqE/SkfB family radical SAM enzyme
MKDSTFCTLAWTSIGMNPSGRVRACGRSAANSSNPSLKDMSISTAWNSDFYKKLRLDMLSGEKNPNCSKCHEQEKLGGYSKRMQTNDLAKSLTFEICKAKTNDEGCTNTKPTMLDIRVGNICNLKCVHCWTGNSSKWYQDKILLNKYENTIDYNIDNTWISEKGSIWQYVRDNFDTIDRLNILGGEPFASKEHNQLIDWMIEHNKLDIEISYVTNGTLLTPTLIKKLKRFKKIELGISLDAVENITNFLRFPTEWTIFKENVDHINESNTLNAYFLCTIYNLNIFHLDTTYQYCQENFKNIPLNLGDFVVTPVHMSVQNLPDDFKKIVHEKVKHVPKIEFYLNYMMDNSLWEQHGQVLHSYLNDLDLARHTDWKTIFPEIKNLYGY